MHLSRPHNRRINEFIVHSLFHSMCSCAPLKYEGVPKSFWTGRLERELQMVQLSDTRCSCIAILWVRLASFAAITLCVASQRVFIVVSAYFVVYSVRKLLNTPSYDAIVLHHVTRWFRYHSTMRNVEHCQLTQMAFVFITHSLSNSDCMEMTLFNTKIKQCINWVQMPAAMQFGVTSVNNLLKMITIRLTDQYCQPEPQNILPALLSTTYVQQLILITIVIQEWKLKRFRYMCNGWLTLQLLFCLPEFL